MHYEVRERKGSLKTEYVNLIIIAEPKSLRFRNFKLKKTYKVIFNCKDKLCIQFC